MDTLREIINKKNNDNCNCKVERENEYDLKYKEYNQELKKLRKRQYEDCDHTTNFNNEIKECLSNMNNNDKYFSKLVLELGEKLKPRENAIFKFYDNDKGDQQQKKYFMDGTISYLTGRQVNCSREKIQHFSMGGNFGQDEYNRKMMGDECTKCVIYTNMSKL